ncbi:hypothetical protein EP51_01455 [Rhodococcus opacus]|uniref:Uncharacterized protein n=1 Tax=Rhodococcus opacus TaxID=37919 RepID=A0A076ECR6_RHOOP|nr:hypothetical protein EP51_01455 [Rhodococcus opacus]
MTMSVRAGTTQIPHRCRGGPERVHVRWLHQQTQIHRQRVDVVVGDQGRQMPGQASLRNRAAADAGIHTRMGTGSTVGQMGWRAPMKQGTT